MKKVDKHWNDEMMELEKRETLTQPSMESWDWRWRAEEAERRLKETEMKLEQALIGIHQIRENFWSISANYRKLLSECLRHLDTMKFYVDLSHHPLTRKEQIDARVEAKWQLVHAIEEFLKKTPDRVAQNLSRKEK